MLTGYIKATVAKRCPDGDSARFCVDHRRYSSSHQRCYWCPRYSSPQNVNWPSKHCAHRPAADLQRSQKVPQQTSYAQCPQNNWLPMHSGLRTPTELPCTVPIELQLTSHAQTHRTTTDLPWTVPIDYNWPPMHRPTELWLTSYAQTHRTQLTSHAQTNRTSTNLSCTNPQNFNRPLMHKPIELQLTYHTQPHRTPTDLSCTDPKNFNQPLMHKPIELQLTSNAQTHKTPIHLSCTDP